MGAGDLVGQGPYAGAVAVDYPGVTYVLGRTTEGYAIWQVAGGVPLHTFPLTDEGWAQAWGAWRGMEGPGQPTSAREWQRGRPIPLGPMLAGQVIGGAVRLYRLNFATLLGVVAPAMVALYAVIAGLILVTATTVPIETPTGTVPVVSVPGWVTVVQNLLNALVIQFLTAAVARAAVDVFRGAAPSVARTYRFAFLKIFPVGWVLILTYASLLLPFFPGFVALWAAFRTESQVAGAIAAILFLGAVAPAVFLWVRLLFSPVTVALEDRRGGAALRRSWQLSRGVGGRIFGTQLLALLIAAGIQIAVTLPFVLAVLSGAQSVTREDLVLLNVTAGVAALFVTPFLNLVIILLYVDARVRKEGSDPDRLWGAVAQPTVAQPGPG
jgi:hypothetical protein